MNRQTLVAVLAIALSPALVAQAQAKPMTFDCQLDRSNILGPKIRPAGKVGETLVIDPVEKKLTVGKKAGTYVVKKLNEASMTGLPQNHRITFNMADGSLTTFESDEFGASLRQDGKCVARGR